MKKQEEDNPMSQKNKKGTYYPKGFDTFRENSGFYEELAILKAQETIAELMKDSGTTRTELAKALNQSKAHVTELLSDGRNLTLRTFTRVCFHLNAEVDFHAYKIGAIRPATNFNIFDWGISHKASSLLDTNQSANSIKNSYSPNTIDNRENYGYESIVNTHTAEAQDKAA